MQRLNINKLGTKIVTLILSITVFVSIFSGSGIQVSADTNELNQFIRDFYFYVWEYEATSNDVQYWVGNFQNGSTGADMVEEFYTSYGWTSRTVNDDEFVNIAFQSILRRTPAEDARNYWVSQLAAGKTRHDILVAFVETNEFANICASLGIEKGTLVPPTVVNLKAEFIDRLYVNFYGRNATQGEINSWTAVFNNGTTASDVIFDFYNGSNSGSSAISNRDFVCLCYRAILNREGSDSDITYWTGKLSSGTSRRQLMATFIGTEEFENICKDMDVARGNINFSAVAESDNRDLSARQRFIKQVYNAFFDRTPNASEYSNWGYAMNTGTTATKFIQSIAFSTGYKNRHVSNEEFVADLYYAVFGRQISEKTQAVYAEELRTKTSKYELLNRFISSLEFQNSCRSLSLAPGYVDLTNTGRWTRLRGARALQDVESGFYTKNGWYYADGYRYYFNADGSLSQNVDTIIGVQSSYFIRVDTVANYLIVYAKTYAGGAYDTPVKAMLCSCGMDETPTILGTYTLRRLDTWWPLNGGLWGQYCTQINGNYLFHSVWYYVRGDKKSITVSGFNALGYRQSHGCVRLTVSDAKWIFERCHGCQVNTAEWQPQPFDKPQPYYAVAVNGDYGYDPRDPGL